MHKGKDAPVPSSGTIADALRQVLGYCCLLAWMSVVFFSRLVHYSTRNDISHLNSTYSFACCGLVCGALAVAASVRLSQRRQQTSQYHPGAGEETTGRTSLAVPLVSCVALSASTVVLALVERRVFMQPWCSIASFVAGCSIALIMVAWARWFVAGGGVRVSLRVTLPFAVAAVLFVAILSLPDVPGVTLTMLLPLASGALLWAQTRSGSGEDTPECAPRPVFEALVPTFARAAVSIGLLPFSESLACALFLVVDPSANSVAYRWLYLCATLVAAGLLVVAASRGTLVQSVRGTNRMCMAALAFLTLLAPVVHGLSLAADLPVLVCYCMFNMLVWACLVMTARAYRLDVRVLFGVGMGVSYAGCLAGTFLGSALTSVFELGWRAECLAALLCAVLVFVALLFIADERVFMTLTDADDERPRAPRRFRLRIKEVAQKYGLTAKETEVLTLAAKGRTAARICEELGISTGTVNTHLMHIYKKLDVHDRQQMLDMLDSRGESE